MSLPLARVDLPDQSVFWLVLAAFLWGFFLLEILLLSECRPCVLDVVARGVGLRRGLLLIPGGLAKYKELPSRTPPPSVHVPI